MFESLGKAFSSAKDRAVEASAKAFLERKLSNFGQIQQLQMDTRARSASITVLLKGEVTPISIQVYDYEIIQRDGASWIRINKVTASREWMGAALQEYVVGQQFKLPSGVSGFL
jgi:hypothetical protein